MRSLLVLAVLLGGAASYAAAQQITSPYRYIERSMSVGLELGHLWTGQVEPDVGPRAAPLFGARFLGRIGGPVSGEVALAFVASEREIYERHPDPEQPPVLLGEASMPIGLAEGGFRLHLTGPRTWRGLAPYVAGTVGIAVDMAGETAIEQEIPTNERFSFGPAFAVGMGLGTDLFVSERLSLRVDARNRLWRVVTPAGFTETGREAPRWRNNPGISVGAAFHF